MKKNNLACQNDLQAVSEVDGHILLIKQGLGGFYPLLHLIFLTVLFTAHRDDKFGTFLTAYMFS